LTPQPSSPALSVAPAVELREAPASFAEVYEKHFDFVWRSVRRLGVRDESVDDVVQEIFLVVHRRLADFEGRSTVKTWLFGIVLRSVRDHRRQTRRKSPHSMRPEAPADPELLSDSVTRGPHETAAAHEAVAVLHRILDEIEDEKREVFVLVELEQVSVPEIAEALGVNTNTVYSRLRAARQEFEQAVQRHRARDGWRFR
jgi:RNA polymerase sigma-70 factor (ECF subfamily)